jgi:hypothetical protein
VLPALAHHAAEATARLILTAASTTSRTIRNGDHSSHHKPDDTTATRHHPATAINTVIKRSTPSLKVPCSECRVVSGNDD